MSWVSDQDQAVSVCLGELAQFSPGSLDWEGCSQRSREHSRCGLSPGSEEQSSAPGIAGVGALGSPLWAWPSTTALAAIARGQSAALPLQ